jgi:hypothetical protein
MPALESGPPTGADGFLVAAWGLDAVPKDGPSTVTEWEADERVPTPVCVAANAVARSSAPHIAPINTRATARGRLGHRVRVATMTAQLSAPFRTMLKRVATEARPGGRAIRSGRWMNGPRGRVGEWR